jgi:hypothetical protein
METSPRKPKAPTPNQLTKVEKNGVEVAHFDSDVLGRRIEKVAGGNATARRDGCSSSVLDDSSLAFDDGS